MAVELRNGYHPSEHLSREHKLETIRRTVKTPDEKKVRLSVQLIDTLPLNGNHNGTIISAPGLGAHPESKDTYEMRHHLNMKDFGAVDWYEAPWGNRLAPFGKDSGLENMRGLHCQNIVLQEMEQRIKDRGTTDEIHLVGWSRGAGLAAAGAEEHASRISTLTLVCPGFMRDSSWGAAMRYLPGRAVDAWKGVKEKGVTHLREVFPFFKAALANPHRMINRGGSAAGWAPLDEMFAAALAGIPQRVYQGKYDETFPPDKVRNTIEQGFIMRYDVLMSNEGRTVFDTNLEALMPEFIVVPEGHGIGTPDEAAELLVDGITQMKQRRVVS
jgi:hypothetical protein